MIETIPFEDERILGIRMSGKIETQDLLPVLDRLNGLLAGDAPLRAYAEVADLEGVSVDAIVKDLSFAFRNFRSLTTRFERVALVSDQSWVRRVTQIEGLMMPGTETRVFSATDAVSAQRWIQGAAD